MTTKNQIYMDTALSLGSSHSYFYVLNHTQPEKMKKIESLDKDFPAAVLKYIEYVSNIISQVEEVLYDFEDQPRYEYWNFIDSLGLTGASNKSKVYSNHCLHVFKLREPKDYLKESFEILENWQTIIKAHKFEGVA